MDKLISKANEAVANKVGDLMVTVYNDAKKLTLSVHSWPSRIVAAQKAANFCYNIPDCNKPSHPAFDLQYVTPKWHSRFLACIVHAHLQDVQLRGSATVRTLTVPVPSLDKGGGRR